MTDGLSQVLKREGEVVNERHVDINGVFFLGLVMVVPEGMPEGAPIEIADVTEGEALVLQCRFDPQRIPPDSAFYWRHGNGQLGDNVALFGVILEKSYR